MQDYVYFVAPQLVPSLIAVCFDTQPIALTISTDIFTALVFFGFQYFNFQFKHPLKFSQKRKCPSKLTTISRRAFSLSMFANLFKVDDEFYRGY